MRCGAERIHLYILYIVIDYTKNNINKNKEFGESKKRYEGLALEVKKRNSESAEGVRRSHKSQI